MPQFADRDFVSVIVPHFNDLDRLELCLDCLQEQTLPGDRYEVIVCDNDSPVGRDAVLARVGNRARVVFEMERGAAAARNRGVREAAGEILAFTDSDCRPDRDWLARGIDGLAEFDVVGGSVQVFVRDEENMTPTEAFEMVFAFRNSKYIRKNGFSVTASLITTKATFMKVGNFTKGVSEDIDWCRRALRANFTLGYREDCIILHPARRTFDELEAKWSRLVMQSYLLAKSEKGNTLRWAVHNWIVLASILPHLLVISVTPKLPRWRDKLRAARALVKIRLYRFMLSHMVMFGYTPR